MRTLILVFLVALSVAIGTASFASVRTDHREDKCIVSLTLNTSMIRSVSQTRVESSGDESLDVKGNVTAVRPEKNEFVVSENVKNWTFILVNGGKVLINDRDAKLADLKAGDEAMVTFERQGQQLFASIVRAKRK